jgi:hypothetical protein
MLRPQASYDVRQHVAKDDPVLAAWDSTPAEAAVQEVAAAAGLVCVLHRSGACGCWAESGGAWLGWLSVDSAHCIRSLYINDLRGPEGSLVIATFDADAHVLRSKSFDLRCGRAALVVGRGLLPAGAAAAVAGCLAWQPLQRHTACPRGCP